MRITSVNPCLVRIETDTGLVGWGEGTPSVNDSQRGAPRVVEMLNTIFTPGLIGRDPIEPMVIWNNLQTLAAPISGHDLPESDAVVAISAIDIALWDISGQVKGQPICKLLSSAIRSQIKVCVDVALDYRWVGQFSSDSPWQPASVAIPEVQPLLDLGFDTFEIKMVGSSDMNKKRVRAAREAFGKHARIVAANHSVKAAPEGLVRAMLSARVSLFVEAIEVHPDADPRLPVPVAWGQHEWKGKKLCDGLASGDVDIIQPNITLCGGFTALLRLLTIAKSHEVLVMPFCSPKCGSGIALAATIQAAAAVPWKPKEGEQEPNPKEPMITLSPDTLRVRNQFVVQKIDGSGGYLHVPEAPGLGTTVDEDILSAMIDI
ncbi:unnamed protein product [Penicillium glandicola]